MVEVFKNLKCCCILLAVLFLFCFILFVGCVFPPSVLWGWERRHVPKALFPFSRPSSVHVLTDMQMNQTQACRDIGRFGFGFGRTGRSAFFSHVVSVLLWSVVCWNSSNRHGCIQASRQAGKKEFLCKGLTAILATISNSFLSWPSQSGSG